MTLTDADLDTIIQTRTEQDDVVAELAKEVRRLRAIVDPLPKFADGTVSYPGDAGWFPGENEPGVVGETGCMCGNDDWGAETAQCYPTRKAAEAAAKEEEP